MPPDDLLNAAKAVWQHAYVPYSGFRVGVALRAKSGVIYQGANIENASYGLSRCGEQSAILAMASAGERAFTEAVVYTAAETPASPCGACRQILFEFSPQADLYLVNQRGIVQIYKVADLLPHGFRLEQ